ncbi:MAG TPA: DNRLRE domain-containing protein [Anaerolineales bacterium]|nr:DNRLRE domain-containing protein [Anaerolineales bacterium]
MTFPPRFSQKATNRNTNISFHSAVKIFLVLILSPLAGCAPTNQAEPSGQEAEVAAALVASSTPDSLPFALPSPTPTITVTSLVFKPEADAWVDEDEPDDNEGDDEHLKVDGESGTTLEAYIRFSIAGISGTVQSAMLRVYAGSDESTDNGPAIYLTESGWDESEITWNMRPARTSNALDNKQEISEDAWVEYNVTSRVTGDGSYSFALVRDSSDGIEFSSRQGEYPPELVVTFHNGPPPTATPTLPPDAAVLVGAGDIASCDNENDEMTAQLLDAIPGTVFTTGDNVYDDGTPEEFMECYDPGWGRHKDRTKPVPGDHDYEYEDGSGYHEYFNDIPPYYAYDLGSWRIYALNTEEDLSVDSEQVAWLQEDLAANPRQCVLAYWHEPRWSSGVEHGSYAEHQELWEILYEAGAELVIHGDEHNYERFAEMDADGSPSFPGMRAFVVGTGGRSLYGFGTPLPASEVRESFSYGVLKLILYPDRYEWEFVPAAGYTFTDRGSTMCH